MAGQEQFTTNEEPFDEENYGLGDSWVPVSAPDGTEEPELYSSASDIVSELADAARDSSSFDTADELQGKEGSSVAASTDVFQPAWSSQEQSRGSRGSDSPSCLSQSFDWRPPSRGTPLSDGSSDEADNHGWLDKLIGRPFPRFWQSRQGLLAAVAVVTVTTVGMMFYWHYLSRRSITAIATL